MDDLASVELCEELHALSGWEPRHLWVVDQDTNKGGYRYALGYLLRKLPAGTDIFTTSIQFGARLGDLDRGKRFFADTPEDAAAKLAIELFRQGVLTREDAR